MGNQSVFKHRWDSENKHCVYRSASDLLGCGNIVFVIQLLGHVLTTLMQYIHKGGAPVAAELGEHEQHGAVNAF